MPFSLHFRPCMLCCQACWTVTHLGRSLHQSSAGGLLECVCVLCVWCQRQFAEWWVCFRLHQTCCSSTRFIQRFRVKCSPTSSSSPTSHSLINSSIKVCSRSSSLISVYSTYTQDTRHKIHSQILLSCIFIKHASSNKRTSVGVSNRTQKKRGERLTNNETDELEQSIFSAL